MLRKPARCTCRRISATTPISMSAFIMPPMSASSSVPIIRCCRTTSTFLSAIMAVLRQSMSPGRRCGVRRARRSRQMPKARASARAVGSTTSWSSASGSGPAMLRGSRSASVRQRITLAASASSTTGLHATSRPGSISRSDRSSPRTLRARFPRGSSRRRRLRRSASPSRSAPRAILRRCPT